MTRRIAAFFAVLLWGALAWGQTAPIAAPTAPAALAALPSGGVAKVAAVVDGDTVVLGDGRQVRLVGIQAPKLPLGRAGFKPWPMGAEAKAHLQALVQGRRVTLRLGDQPVDRHGRVLAHLVRGEDGLWVQGALLAAGLARVYTFPDNRRLATEMLAAERGARADGRGIWALPFFALRTPDNVRFDAGTYQIVEGRVLETARIKDRVYLNFGPDWRSDFTVKVLARDEPPFAEAGLDLVALKGRRVRVRGWIKDENGPMIVLDHPERLEILGQ